MLGHRPFLPPLLDSIGNLFFHFARACPVLLRIGEHAQPLEARRPDEFQQRLKIFLRLAGKSDNERRAQSDARHARADSGDEIDNVLLRCFPAHPFQHVLVDVLQRHIDVARHLGTFRNGADQFIGPMGRMRVKQTNPKISRQII